MSFRNVCRAAAAALVFALAQAPLTAPSPAVAQETTDSDLVQVPLNPDLVSRFVASYPEFDALRVDLEKKFGTTNTGGDEIDDPIYGLQALLDKPEAKTAIDAVLTKHGFKTFADWANTANSVFLAFGASDPDAGVGDLDSSKKAEIDEVNADASLSAEDKKAALEEIESRYEALKSYVPLPGNIEAVKPHLETIRKMLEGDGTATDD